jgi:hypothetical protein
MYSFGGGWTVSAILNSLCGYTIRIPGGLDYEVVSYEARGETPVISVIKQLLPVPGLTISRIGDSFYVSSPSKELNLTLPGTNCWQLGYSVETKEFSNTVQGLD